MSAKHALSGSQLFKISGWGFLNKTPNNTSPNLTVWTAHLVVFFNKTFRVIQALIVRVRGWKWCRIKLWIDLGIIYIKINIILKSKERNTRCKWDLCEMARCMLQMTVESAFLYFLGDSSRDMCTMWEENSLWEDGRKMQRLSSGEPSWV